MFVLAGGLLGLIALLAYFQYRWLGQISDAERERMRATLQASASGFAEDFDRELNRAYLLFQIGPLPGDESVPSQMASRYDRWQATARFPKMIKDVYLATSAGGAVTFKHFNPSTRFVEPAEWPDALAPVRARIAKGPVPSVWPDAPALVVSAPFLFVSRLDDRAVTEHAAPSPTPPERSYAVLLLDGAYIRGEVLPSLAQNHFQGSARRFEYEIAVVPAAGSGTLYQSVAGFTPKADAKVDASADLFHLRVQDFGPLAAEISRFAFFTAAAAGPGSIAGGARGASGSVTARTERVIRHFSSSAKGTMTIPGRPVSIFIQETGRTGVSATVDDQLYATASSAPGGMRFTTTNAPSWRLLVKHPSGSLERAVGSVRRRNLLVSTGILGILGVSVAFLVVSTRRAHDLARQQLEFVATVSHELRTPLAVIRSAADNLADGVVGDEARVRQYGELVRREGVRLSELVEQILEFAGLQSGRAAARGPVTIDAVLREAVAAAQSPADASGVRVELSIADGLPAVAGDEAALRRAFLHLIGNAVKYGATAGWVGVRATSNSGNGGQVEVAVSDRGIGIAPSEQEKIFEPFYRAPDVVAAQIQGAGLGLSLVKRIVDAHGGRIAVTSTPGQGSIFTVTLPAMSGKATTDTRGVGETAAQPL
jgi:two-component system, OmpR family, sensor histidine kinase SenX3